MKNIADSQEYKSQNYLLDNWTCWAHLPNNNNWDLSSYIKIININTAEDTCKYIENFPDILIKNCMLFIMREGINPYWEDIKNINGGCFSYKINNKNIIECWKNLSYLLLGETLTEDKLSHHINGITISPKKNFCIVKIWLNTCEYDDASIIKNISELPKHNVIFKKHLEN
tara:strand:+ start:711 stop:1223 length:513 start_codon:yes stop_codon:yes gene_type:complete